MRPTEKPPRDSIWWRREELAEEDARMITLIVGSDMLELIDKLRCQRLGHERQGILIGRSMVMNCMLETMEALIESGDLRGARSDLGSRNTRLVFRVKAPSRVIQ